MFIITHLHLPPLSLMWNFLKPPLAWMLQNTKGLEAKMFGSTLGWQNTPVSAWLMCWCSDVWILSGTLCHYWYGAAFDSWYDWVYGTLRLFRIRLWSIPFFISLGRLIFFILLTLCVSSFGLVAKSLRTESVVPCENHWIPHACFTEEAVALSGPEPKLEGQVTGA